MRALVDRHHDGLYYSLQLLFEDRLGIDLYTPTGHDWWDAGYWRFGEGYGDDRLAQQFLSTDGWHWTIGVTGEQYYTFDPHHPGRIVNGVTLNEARTMEWDYVIATVQDNQYGFTRLADELGATFVMQVGNTNQFVDWSLNPLALVSSEVPIIKERAVRYHQEIDRDVFAYREPTGAPVIRSFVNCFASTPCERQWREAAALLPEVEFGSHGIDGPDGDITAVTDIADLMAGSSFGWHDKVQGDGFGHIIHDWAAIGRPLIGHASHYRGLMAEGFWQDGITCIDLDKHSIEVVAEMVRLILADPPTHRMMCEAIRAEFDKIDWDGEAEAIRALLMPTAVPA